MNTARPRGPPCVTRAHADLERVPGALVTALDELWGRELDDALRATTSVSEKVEALRAGELALERQRDALQQLDFEVQQAARKLQSVRAAAQEAAYRAIVEQAHSLAALPNNLSATLLEGFERTS